jgi:hypothetical protein
MVKNQEAIMTRKITTLQYVETKAKFLVALRPVIAGTLLPFLFSVLASAQWTGLRVQGQQIVDQNGNNVLLKGFGTGEIFNTEAYMLERPDGGKGQALWYYGYTRIHETIATGVILLSAKNRR